jgi:hypothetical protein
VQKECNNNDSNLVAIYPEKIERRKRRATGELQTIVVTKGQKSLKLPWQSR